MYKVLIVDDDRLMRNVVRKIVSSCEDFEIIGEGDNGEAALAICQEMDVDLIFLDIVMPQMDGISTAREIRRYYPHITICFVSAFFKPEYMKQIMDLQMNHFIKKPVSPKELTSFLHAYKNQSRREISDQIPLNLQDCSFCQALQMANETIHQLCNQKDYTETYLYNQLIAMAQYVYDHMTSLGNKTNVHTIYPLQREWIRQEELVKLWFFQILNHIWQERSIARYDLLKPVFSYLEFHIKENISLADIVKNCMVSQGYLSRIFRDQFDISVMDYIKLRKIHMIKVNLLLSSASITDIAEHLGYSDAKYMGKVFKKEEGRSLNEYRKLFFIA